MNVPVIPVELRAEGATLLLVWPDGARQRLTVAALRAACLCGPCRAARLRGKDPTQSIPADLALTGIAPMGYGVQLVFSDGHDRGIYPWNWLENFPSTPAQTTLTAPPGKATSSVAPSSMPR
ncbi:DUF971 domain-containing protein [Paraburkholderia bannensis]|uniref:DUF971 domain-containing protein n=1 Tax=Paraburkholderia bannensis TaxID=765414 RepID=UPI002ABD4C1F|nr:DUF971 domain-containing protein [Paraburkholderia bannensis]